ncbi:formylglycine-generating enzyme family protein [Janthinobacterium sp. HLS12-2]|uniref:formylglycine-generating enzyme family protein n=1 Tax=Janthinobacterium sp. HLS12-2 TaxID=1259324 RepID=UPI003F206087
MYRLHDILAELDASFVTIDAGNILLKNEAKNSFWKEELRAFAICRFPVTEQLYREITGGELCPGSATCPVVDVSWLDAIAFCNHLSHLAGLTPCYDINGESVTWDPTAQGYRLPTEAEWEYACRAGGQEVRYGDLDAIGWHAGNSNDSRHPVGEKVENALGLYDMIGNVWEWCWDRFDPDVYGEYRVFRGGGWLDVPNACRASCRRKSHPTYRIDDLGFRIVRSCIQ